PADPLLASAGECVPLPNPPPSGSLAPAKPAHETRPGHGRGDPRGPGCMSLLRHATDEETGPAAAVTGSAVGVLRRAPTRARPWYLDVWVQMVRRKPLGTIGGVIVLVMLASAVLADWIVPYGFAQTSLRERFIPMNAAHWLGTDQLGRDLLTRLIYGARISLYVGFGAVAIGSLLATAVGVS